MAEKQILISIDDPKAKYISEVISNKTCQKILDFLSEKDKTVSEISKELKIPINTVDYNIHKLEKAGLISKKSYWWSTRGKKMHTYTVSNKKIVISPAKSKSYINYILALVITGFVAVLIKALKIGQTKYEIIKNFAMENEATIVESTTKQVSDSFSAVTQERVSDVIKPSISQGAEVVMNGTQGTDLWLWFLIGAWFCIVLFFIISLISERGSKK